jgi:proteasome lid subunit RPN8/RPN11
MAAIQGWEDMMVNIILEDKIKTNILKHANRQQPRECCGLLAVYNGKQRYYPCNNLATNTNTFVMDVLDFAAVEDEASVLAIVHSHTVGDCQPSMADLQSCERSRLPWIIVNPNTEQFYQFEPSGYVAPIVGRPYIYTVFDCYTLIRDWYKQNFNIELQIEYTAPSLETWSSNPIFDLKLPQLIANHFYEVSLTDVQRGDLLLFCCTSQSTDHLGIYLGEQRFVHHSINRLSSVDLYGGYWLKQTNKVMRYAYN